MSLRRSFFAGLSLLILAVVLCGCSGKSGGTTETDSLAPGSTAEGNRPAAGPASAPPGKATAVAEPHYDPAPAGVETGNYQGGKK